jgi:hypothetical protein
MGLFDGWRRKKAAQTTPQIKAPEKSQSTEGELEDGETLLAEYNLLVQRRTELQAERAEFTAKLDRGEIDPDEFRKELMNRMQEAATVSEKIRTIAAKLASLGYRGVRS